MLRRRRRNSSSPAPTTIRAAPAPMIPPSLAPVWGRLGGEVGVQTAPGLTQLNVFAAAAAAAAGGATLAASAAPDPKATVAIVPAAALKVTLCDPPPGTVTVLGSLAGLFTLTVTVTGALPARLSKKTVNVVQSD